MNSAVKGTTQLSDSSDLLRTFKSEGARVSIHRSIEAAGRAAAVKASVLINQVISEQGRARVIVATGNSQIPLVAALLHQKINWGAVEVFHMDEYVGLSASHPSSFRHWIKARIEQELRPRVVHYLEGDAVDLDSEIKRYAELLNDAPIDAAFVGFGENGHIAFNDPPIADFRDPQTIKIAALDEACRRQQAGEGHFKDVDSVPKEALTITCPGLFRARSWICCVPEGRKAAAVKNALEGPVSESCPASLVRRHPDANVFLDRDSSALLST